MAVGLGLYLTGGRYVSEENAYVGAGTLSVAPQVSGQVQRVAVRQNQRVAAGDVLFVVDPEPYRIALDGARAQLGIVRAQISAQIESYRALGKTADQARANLNFAEQQLQRAQELTNRGIGTQAQLDAALRDQQAAAAALASAEAQANAALAQLGGDGDLPIEQRPQYLAAESSLANAERNLRLTQVRAPWPGTVTNVSAIDVGTFLPAGQQAVSIVSSDRAWVDANLRESDLTHVKPNDPADIVTDTYPDISFHGRVDSINPASGAVFSLIPPQNASGNWVKVVQRIPVRIAFDRNADRSLLRAGMSATVTIDTGHRRTLSDLWHSIAGWL